MMANDTIVETFYTKDQAHNAAKMLFEWYAPVESGEKRTIELLSGKTLCIDRSQSLWWAIGEDWKCTPWPPGAFSLRYEIRNFHGDAEKFMRDMIELRLMADG